MKKVLKLLRRIIFSFLILYGFNMIGTNFNIMIPFNIITISSVTVFGFTGMLALILLFVLIK